MLDKIIGHQDIKKMLLDLKFNLPKVLLFNGPNNVGKVYTAYNYIDELYCGSISDRLKTHPDIIYYYPETKVFKKELVHKIQQNLNQYPIELDKKFYILKNVELMNKEAANACLKILEDCPKFVHFIMTCENSDQVIKTVLSRSTLLEFKGLDNIEEHYPRLTNLEIKFVQGCVGNIESLKDKNILDLYTKLSFIYKNLNNLDFSEIIFKAQEFKDADFKVILKLLYIIFLEDPKCTEYFFKELEKFGNKLNTSISIYTHFKYLVIALKEGKSHGN